MGRSMCLMDTGAQEVRITTSVCSPALQGTVALREQLHVSATIVVIKVDVGLFVEDARLATHKAS